MVSARAEAAPAKIRTFFISSFPTGSNTAAARPLVRSPVSIPLTAPAYPFPQGHGYVAVKVYAAVVTIGSKIFDRDRNIAAILPFGVTGYLQAATETEAEVSSRIELR